MIITPWVRSQCNVTITASPSSVPCGGANVTLTATGTGYNTTPINNTFDLGNAGPNWAISPAGQFNNPCGPSVDGGLYMWMGSSTAAPRTLQTAPLDLTCGGNVCFYLKFAVQGYSSPCEGPDLTNEGVYFQYSLNGGASWTTINYFQPNAGGTSGPYLNWAQYCFPIPAVAQTPTTIFRWYQGGSSGFAYDHWGIDNVIVSATNCGSVWYDWANIPGTTGPTGDPASQTVFVSSDSTFTVCYTDGNQFNCCQDISINVQGMNSPTATVTNETCAGDNDGSAVLSATGGVGPYVYTLLTGPGINTPLAGIPMSGPDTYTNLNPGNYTFSVQDMGSPCSVNGSFSIGAGPVCCTLDHTETITDLTCNTNNGACDGVIDISASGAVGNVVYSIDNGATVQNSPLFVDLCPGNYTILLTDANNCTSTSNITINEPLEIVPNLVLSNTLCFNSCDGTAAVSPTNINGGYSVTWTNINGTQVNNNALCAGFYNVELTDDAGCMAEVLNWEITEPSEFVILSSVVNEESCVNSCDGSIEINAPGGVSYSIDNGISTVNTNLFQALCPGSFNVVAFNANGCSDDTLIVIDSAIPINITASPDTVICQNGTATLSANAFGGQGGFTYFWDNLQQSNTINVSPANNQSVSVYATDGNGCQSQTLSIQVAILPPLSIDFQQNYSICQGDEVTLELLVVGGDDNYTFEWIDLNTGSVFSNEQEPVVSPLTNTSYSVTVSDGCETTPVTGVINVAIYEVPTIQFTAFPNNGCTPLEVQFVSNTDLSNVASFSWDLGISNSNDTMPIAVYENENCYDITYSIVTNDGCVDQLTIPELVCAYITPEANFNFLNGQLSSLQNELNISNTSSNADYYNWGITHPNFTMNSLETNIYEVLPDDMVDGVLNVCLEAYTNFGCADTLCKPISYVQDVLVYVPNTFTPDGNQYNNTFLPVLSGIDIYDYRLEVFNRWGEKLFESNDSSVGWDGTYNNVLVPSDTYVWKITYRAFSSGKRALPMTGHINVLR
jgi:gliding motility-associated-like protein